MYWKNEEHKARYHALVQRARCVGDNERMPMLYMIASDTSLYSRANEFYDFSENGVIVCRHPETLKVSSSQRWMLAFGANLFGGIAPEQYGVDLTPINVQYFDTATRNVIYQAMHIWLREGDWLEGV